MVAQAAVVEENSGNYERSCERAPPGLVRSRDQARAKFPIEPQESLAGAGHGREDSGLLGGLYRVSLGKIALSDFRVGPCLRRAGAVLSKLTDPGLLAHLAAEVVELGPVHVADRRVSPALNRGMSSRNWARSSVSITLLIEGGGPQAAAEC